MISSYSDYLTQIMRLIDGDDVSVSEIPRATLEQISWLAQRKIYREVKSRHNEKSFSAVTTTGNAATLPADFENISIVHFGGKALTPITEEAMREYMDGNPTGESLFVSAGGSQLQFGPGVADGTAVQGRYFYRFADLTEANFSANTLIANEPDLFIYAALVESVPFFEGAARQSQVFMAKYEMIKTEVNNASARVATNAARLVRTPSARLIA